MSDYPRDQQDAVELDANRRRYEAERKLETAESSRAALRQALQKVVEFARSARVSEPEWDDEDVAIIDAAEALLAHGDTPTGDEGP